MENTQRTAKQPFWHPEGVPYNDYTLWYVNDKQTGKITCMVCGKEGHYTCECPMKDIEKDVICTLCSKVGHCHLWCCHQYENEKRACRRCGEKGHYDDLHHLGCSSCEKHHPVGRCPMGKITCFLCEGRGHVPVQCHLSPVLTAVQRKSSQTTPRQTMTETSNSVVPPISSTIELEPYNESYESQPKWDNEMVPKVLGFNQGVEGHSAFKNPIRCHVLSTDKTNVAADKGPNQALGVICFNCGVQGHYAKKCPQNQKQHGVRSTAAFGPLPCHDSYEHEPKGNNKIVTKFGFNLGMESRCARKSAIRSQVQASNKANAAAMKDKAPNVKGVTCFTCGGRGLYSYTCPQNLLEIKLTTELEPHDDTYEHQPKGDNGTAPTVLSLNCGEASDCDRRTNAMTVVSPSDKINPTGMTLMAPKRALGVICYNCHNKGHYAKRCPQKQQGAYSDTSQCPTKRLRKE